ncbi:mechanosensitive ion channel family protein [Alcaligenaceae bacterium]|nr:mechanosensitive ion channel family protein [Alcaligenaceae bacterium]
MPTHSSRFFSTLSFAVRCLLLTLLLALASVTAAAYAQDKALADVDKSLDAARAQIDKVQKDLKAAPDKPLTDADLVALRETALEAQEEAQAIAKALEPQLVSIQERVAQLGQPVEGAKEAPDIALQRAELNKASTKLDAQIKLARLISLEAGQASDQILKLRRSLFQAELGVRTTSILDDHFWSDLRTQLPEDLRSAKPLHEELSRAATAAGSAAWTGALLAILAVLVLRVLAGRLLLQLTTTRVAPGRLRRSLYASAQLVLAALAPGLIGEVLRQTLGWKVELSANMAELLSQSVGAVYFGGFVAGLGRALLSWNRPTWRLLPLPDSVARGLRWFPTVLAIILVTGWVTQRLAAILNASLLATVAQNCAVALALSLTLALATYRAEGLRRKAMADTSGEPAPAGVAYGFFRLLIWFAIFASVACLLIGYIALGSFIIKQAAWVGIVIAVAYLLNGLIDDACHVILAAIRRSADDDNYTRTMTRVRGQATVVLSGLARAVIMLLAIVLLAAPFGDGPAAWVQRLDALYQGIAIGELNIRPTAVGLAIVVLLLGLVLVKVIKTWLDRQFLPVTSLDPGMRLSAATLFGYAGYVLVIALSLSAVGIGLERVAWIASALSVGIGFGLQAVVQNFVSGLILLAERPVRVGDWVSLGTVEGDIRRINVRATEIQMGDRSTVIVPNSEFITKIVRNVTHAGPLGRVQIKLTLPVTVLPEQIHDLMLAAFEANEEVLKEPAADVMLDGVDPNGLIFVATGYVSSPRAAYRVRSALLFVILKVLREQNVPLVSPALMVMQPPEASGAASGTDTRNPDSPTPRTGLA